MKFHSKFIAFLSIAALFSCKQQTLTEDAIAFSMSEEMYSNCEFATAKMDSVKNEIRFFGKIEADNNKTAEVFSVVGGLVTSIKAGLGDYVKQGDVLATIQSSEVAQFEQERKDAINDVKLAEKRLQTQKDLHQSKLNTDNDLVSAENELKRAKAKLARINEIYKIYNLKSGSVFPVIAPISGFVISKNISINAMLRSDETEPLFSIADTDEIWAVAYVNESDISQIKENYDVFVNTLAFPDDPYNGKIEKIYNVIDAQTKSMKFRVRLKNSDFKLKPEMNCAVNVHYIEDKKMITVPTSAIVFDKSKYWTLVYNNRKDIKIKQVEIYRQVGDITYLLSGLKAGDKVITKNSLLVYNAINE